MEAKAYDMGVFKYRVENEQSYDAISNTVKGITAKIEAGMLANGDEEISVIVYGIPDGSVTGATFNVSLLNLPGITVTSGGSNTTSQTKLYVHVSVSCCGYNDEWRTASENPVTNWRQCFNLGANTAYNDPHQSIQGSVTEDTPLTATRKEIAL
jgi:hypothetical protein